MEATPGFSVSEREPSKSEVEGARSIFKTAPEVKHFAAHGPPISTFYFHDSSSTGWKYSIFNQLSETDFDRIEEVLMLD